MRTPKIKVGPGAPGTDEVSFVVPAGRGGDWKRRIEEALELLELAEVESSDGYAASFDYDIIIDETIRTTEEQIMKHLGDWLPNGLGSIFGDVSAEFDPSIMDQLMKEYSTPAHVFSRDDALALYDKGIRIATTADLGASKVLDIELGDTPIDYADWVSREDSRRSREAQRINELRWGR